MRSFFKSIRTYLRQTDKLMLLLCAFCSAIGCLLLFFLKRAGYFSTLSVFFTQFAALLIGVAGALAVSSADYHTLAKLWPIHLTLTVIPVALTFTPLGILRAGSDDKAWLNLGFATIQPSEFLKLSFILTFAMHLAACKEKLNRPRNVLLLCLHGFAPVLLIAAQGDLGSALVFFFVFLSMLFAAGLSWKYSVPFFGILAVAAPFVWLWMPDYLKQRFYVAWKPSIDPFGMGMQQLNGLTALGSGGLFGSKTALTDPVYVPEMHNDFIFSYIGQCFGFFGCVACVLLLCAICARILSTARRAKDPLGAYICVGVFAVVLFQSVVNVGMVLCVLPVIGVTLPFFSAGGSSLCTLFVGVGFVMSVARQNRKSRLFP